MQSLACWDCRFESCQKHGCLSLENVCVCCQVEVSAKGRSLIQKSPIEWVCVRMWSWNLNNEAAKAQVSLFAPQEKKYEIVVCACELAGLISVAVYLVISVHQFQFRLVMAWTPSVRNQRPSLIKDVTWSKFVFVHRHFEVGYQSRLQRPRSRKKFRGVKQWYRLSKRDLCLSSAQTARTLGTLHTLWISKLFLEIPYKLWPGGGRNIRWFFPTRKLPPLCMPSPTLADCLLYPGYYSATLFFFFPSLLVIGVARRGCNVGGWWNQHHRS